MTGKLALARFPDKLTEKEKEEIVQYSAVYFLGEKHNKPDLTSPQADTAHNGGFDDVNVRRILTLDKCVGGSSGPPLRHALPFAGRCRCTAGPLSPGSLPLCLTPTSLPAPLAMHAPSRVGPVSG